MLKFLSTRIMPGVVVACLSLVSTAFGGHAETIDEEDIQPVPFHYLVMQDKTTPLWIETVQNEDHVRMESLQLKEQYAIPYKRNYVWAELHEIGAWSFFCSKLKALDVPSSVKEIGEAAFQGSELEAITLNEGLVTIGEGAFASTKLRQIDIPASVKVIGTEAFVDCRQLENVTLPATLTNLSGKTFIYCCNLKEITCHAVTPPAASDSDFYFKDNGPHPDSDPNYHRNIDFDKCVLYVPAEAVDRYRQAEGWKRFKNIFAVESSGTDMPAADGLDAKYRVEKGAVSILGQAGDNVEIYDLGGILLDSRRFGNAGTYRYEGEGVRIISINGVSVKIIL